ncbi:MAG: hypothetical protein HYT09_03990 [Candidatus Levybacteria bacterium]|nr:hypothetical protein [Candidatus Levybacteria bacterium]
METAQTTVFVMQPATVSVLPLPLAEHANADRPAMPAEIQDLAALVRIQIFPASAGNVFALQIQTAPAAKHA